MITIRSAEPLSCFQWMKNDTIYFLHLSASSKNLLTALLTLLSLFTKNDKLFKLSGPQGENKEGMLHLTFSFAPIEQPVQGPGGVAQQAVREPVQITDEDLKEFADMFPSVDKEVVKCILEEKRGKITCITFRKVRITFPSKEQKWIKKWENLEIFVVKINSDSDSQNYHFVSLCWNSHFKWIALLKSLI